MTTSPKFAFIKASWHARIVDQAEVGFCEHVLAKGMSPPDVIAVPGAFELPLAAQRLAEQRKHAGIVAAAFVVDGGIYRHEFVAKTVLEGLMQVQLKLSVPVYSVVLTPHNYQETEAHEAFFAAHFVEKGREAAHAALQVERLRNVA